MVAPSFNSYHNTFLSFHQNYPHQQSVSYQYAKSVGFLKHIVVQKSRFKRGDTTSLNISMAMFLQASIHWKISVKYYLWPMVFMYAAYNKNYTPRTKCDLLLFSLVLQFLAIVTNICMFGLPGIHP